MSIRQLPGRTKSVPTLYEADSSKYVGPHPLQLTTPARLLRKLAKPEAYTRWAREAFTDVTVQGTEYLDAVTGPAIFVANHTSHLDTILTQTALPDSISSRLYYGAAQDRWFVKGQKKVRLQPWYQSFVLGTFPILRGGGIDALRYASRILESGQHVFLFPEGTRATGEELGEFKHGATLLALRHQAPVVPLYLSGLRRIRPKGSREVRPGPVGIDILPPQVFAPGTDLLTATSAFRDLMNDVHRSYFAAEERAA
jgi:1-acyl-sn-glycerol-3-phosphate acyltransferase